MDILQAMTIRGANSMKVFADGDETFVLGEWKDWRDACQLAGKQLPPNDFKAKKREAANRS